MKNFSITKTRNIEPAAPALARRVRTKIISYFFASCYFRAFVMNFLFCFPLKRDFRLTPTGSAGFRLNSLEIYIYFAFGQRNDENRYSGSAQDPFCGAAQKRVANDALAVSPHDNDIAGMFFGPGENFFSCKTFSHLDGRRAIFGVRIILQFLIAQYV